MKHSYDFSSIPTEELRRQNLEMARRVHDVTGAAWDTMPMAFAWTCAIVLPAAGLAVFAAFKLAGSLWLTTAAYAVIVALAWAAIMVANAPWRKAIRGCREYTAELNARTAELKRRRQGDGE